MYSAQVSNNARFAPKATAVLQCKRAAQKRRSDAKGHGLSRATSKDEDQSETKRRIARVFLWS
jgi:hypothetical protein